MKVPGSSGTAESVVPIMSKIGEKRRKSCFGAALVRNCSNRIPSHESNLSLTFLIEWHSPFVAAVLRCRDTGSETEIRPFFEIGDESHENSVPGVFGCAEIDSDVGESQTLHPNSISGGHDSDPRYSRIAILPNWAGATKTVLRGLSGA